MTELHVHERGAGKWIALLIHGGMADHRTRHAVEDHLVGPGHRAPAPGPRGHGRSPRAEYRPELPAEDRGENLPAGADVAVGHSLGGPALALTADRLRPARTVYSDPGFLLRNVPVAAYAAMRERATSATAGSVRARNPRSSEEAEGSEGAEEDVAAELAGLALFDLAFVAAIETCDPDCVPSQAVVPSLVQLAEPSLCVDDAGAALSRKRGFGIRVVPRTGHCIHRDGLPGFPTSLDGWWGTARPLPRRAAEPSAYDRHFSTSFRFR